MDSDSDSELKLGSSLQACDAGDRDPKISRSNDWRVELLLALARQSNRIFLPPLVFLISHAGPAAP
ncbi:uncharacterized protein G2W53_022722 [Senna tora]|uniref:Uncharacterized protein n=1 Tax=Senna tora TaxID=362788 RepID=A0A834TLM4_9FABA|nr:uncharacterized protein G2W53_022722 [Senna tora]